MSAHPRLRAGSVLAGRFEIADLVRTRDALDIYRARDRERTSDAAVVVARPDDIAGFLARAERVRARLGACLAFGKLGGGLCFVAEDWIDGPTLADYLDTNELAPDHARRVFAQVTSALAVAHAHGLVHGDVTASRITLTDDGRAVLGEIALVHACADRAGDLDAVDRLASTLSLYGRELSPGAQCGDYVVEGAIGRGGSGRVYRARHRVLERRVALKVLDREYALAPTAYQRFVLEARASTMIGHPAIVDVHDLGRLADGRPYLAMELLEGATLAERLGARERLAPQALLAILRPLAAGLAATHARGIVHRDLKPSNVFLTSAGRVVLLDFGIAKLLERDPVRDGPALTTASTRLGTPTAMAPEQLRGGAVDARTDLYALGVLVYRALAGAWPFEASDPLELERMHLEVEPALAALPGGLRGVVARCLAKDPRDRFASAAEVVAAFAAVVGAEHPVRSSRPRLIAR